MASLFGPGSIRGLWPLGVILGVLTLGGCGTQDGNGTGTGSAWLGDPRVEANGAVYRTYAQRDGEAEIEMGLVATSYSLSGEFLEVTDPCDRWTGDWRSFYDIVLLPDPYADETAWDTAFSGHFAPDGRSLSGRWRTGDDEDTPEQGSWRWEKVSNAPSLGSYGTVQITTPSWNSGVLETVYAHRLRRPDWPDRLEVCVNGIGQLSTSALDLLATPGTHAVPDPFPVAVVGPGLPPVAATGTSVTVTTPLGPGGLGAVFDLVFPPTAGYSPMAWDVNLTKIDDPSAP